MKTFFKLVSIGAYDGVDDHGLYSLQCDKRQKLKSLSGMMIMPFKESNEGTTKKRS